MNKEDLEIVIRDAFKAGILKGEHLANNNYFDAPLDENEYVEEFFKPKEVEKEKTVRISLGMIRLTCGWSKYCDITGGNHYMLKEWSVEDNEMFDVKISHAKELELIP